MENDIYILFLEEFKKWSCVLEKMKAPPFYIVIECFRSCSEEESEKLKALKKSAFSIQEIFIEKKHRKPTDYYLSQCTVKTVEKILEEKQQDPKEMQIFLIAEKKSYLSQIKSEFSRYNASVHYCKTIEEAERVREGLIEKRKNDTENQKEETDEAEQEECIYDMGIMDSLSENFKQPALNTETEEEKKQEEETAGDVQSEKENQEEDEEKESPYPVVKDLKDARAAISYHLLERFQRHLNQTNGAILDAEDAFRCLTLLLKSSDSNAFHQSWNIVSGKTLTIKNEDYEKLKEEAVYYYSMSALLYEKDHFGD